MNHTARKTRAQRPNRMYGTPFSALFNEMFDMPATKPVNRASVPAANIIKMENAFAIEFALPGVAKENVSINIEKNTLTIASNSEAKEDVNYRLREFNFSNFERAYTLPELADTDNILAKFDNGILNITIPMIEEAGPKSITVQ